ncbi:MAG TPA: aminoglycoside phosphotransferase family protein [Microlunatus sp.]
MDPAYARFRALVQAGALDPVGELELVTSYSNDAWYVRSASAGDIVLRVCWIGDRGRLLREAAVGRALPADVGYPEVLASGETVVEGEWITWMISRRLSGTTLRTAWPELAERQREQALRDVAGPLRALHDWRPPADVAARLGAPPPSTDPQTIVGSTILPLPLERVRHLVAPAADRAPEHRATIEEAWSWVIDHADLLPRLDDPADVVTHGDLHLDNVWWDGNRVAGLLDLEWVRWGPAWIDLVPVRDNAVAADEFSQPHARLFESLLAHAPGLEVPDVELRLTVVELAFQLRQILVWPPPGPDPAIDHPVRLLQRLLDLSR